VDIIRYQKLHIVLMKKGIWFYIEKEDGSQIKRFYKLNRENINNNKKERSINMLVELKMHLFLKIDWFIISNYSYDFLVDIYYYNLMSSDTPQI